ncbi:MAG: transpeptidase family protein [Bacilli bacterium]|nr:transpeptidase family protein [Bacilli bacterium]
MKNKKRRNNVKYSRLLIIASLFLVAIMIARLVQLSIAKEIDGINLQDLASKRTTRTTKLEAKRGTIYSANNDVLAQNVTSYKLIAYLSEARTTNEKKPQHVVDKEKTAEKLAPILGMEKEEILKYLNKKNLYQTEFGNKGKGLTEIQKNEIENLGLPGLDFIESYKRYYPKGNFLSYTLGYATQDEDKEGNYVISGKMGLELYYDNILKGEDGYVTYQKDLRGYKISGTNEIRHEATQGKDIYLTIDSNVQFFVEQALTNAKNNFGYEWFTMVIMDAKTGKILGLSSNPNFDLNTRNDIKNYLDQTIASPYEPGSTMKTFTYMAAMENNVYDGNATYKSGVYVTTDGTEIGDWNRNGWGYITYDRGYALSSNVGVINLLHNFMNSAMLRQYYKKLGFGKKTGITLPNESAGKISFKYETEIYNAGFGQGITTTPLQNVQAMTPLTNNGILLKPYIVEKIVDPTTEEVIFSGKKTERDRVASTQTVQKMISLMDDTVNGIGNTGSGYRIESGELIGKTGTAQIAASNGRGYLNGQEDIISSFSGIYPKSNPQFIIYASVQRPSGGSQKGISTAVKEVISNLSKYYGTEVSDTKGEKITTYKLPALENKKVDAAKQILNSNAINNIIIIGNGNKVIKEYPEKDTTITTKDRVFLITNDSNLTVPNVVGYSSKEAVGILKLLGIKTKLTGTGYVTSQSIKENEPINSNMEIELILNPKFDANIGT